MVSRFDSGKPFPNETEDQRNERMSMSASYGHLTRRLDNREPLTGRTLELALNLVTPDPSAEKSSFTDQLNGMVIKLKSGEVLDEYEAHLIIDVLLVHERLRG